MSIAKDIKAYIAEQFTTTRRKDFSLTDDYVFKAVFGQDNDRSKQALILLLNTILDRKDDPITRIRILNTIIIGQSDVSKEGICRRVPRTEVLYSSQRTCRSPYLAGLGLSGHYSGNPERPYT